MDMWMFVECWMNKFLPPHRGNVKTAPLITLVVQSYWHDVRLEEELEGYKQEEGFLSPYSFHGENQGPHTSRKAVRGSIN